MSNQTKPPRSVVAAAIVDVVVVAAAAIAAGLLSAFLNRPTSLRYNPFYKETVSGEPTYATYFFSQHSNVLSILFIYLFFAIL